MTYAELAQPTTDNVALHFGTDQNSANPFVDMANPRDAQNFMASYDNQGQSSAVANGQLVFDNPYNNAATIDRAPDYRALSDSVSDATATGSTTPTDSATTTTASTTPTEVATTTPTSITPTDTATTSSIATTDPMVAQLAENGDPTLAGTLIDASSQLSPQGYSQLEQYISQNYSGPSNDNQLMGQALSQAGLSSSDQTALQNVLQTDMPQALSSSTSSSSGSDSGSSPAGSDSGSSSGQTGNANIDQQILQEIMQIEQALVQLTGEVEQLMEGDGGGTSGSVSGSGGGSGGSGCDGSTGSSGSNGSGTTTGSGSGGSGGSDGSGGTSGSGGSSSAYNPLNDQALLNLSNTGDGQLQQTLYAAWGDVQNGSLSQSAYNQFEAASIPLTTPANDPGGIPYQTELPLEQQALTTIQPNISAADATTLNNVINSVQSADTSSTYNPVSDAPLQNLSNTGDAQLQQTLYSAWGDVQNGTLSQSAYNQFEATSIPLTTPANDPGGIPYQTELQLEDGAMSTIQPNISTADATTLQNIINGVQTNDFGSTTA